MKRILKQFAALCVETSIIFEKKLNYLTSCAEVENRIRSYIGSKEFDYGLQPTLKAISKCSAYSYLTLLIEVEEELLGGKSTFDLMRDYDLLRIRLGD